MWSTVGMLTLLALGIVLLTHAPSCLWWSCEHMVTADRGIFAFTSPTLGSWPISSRPEGANQGPAFRVSCIKAEPDAELAGPPTPFLNPAEP